MCAGLIPVSHVNMEGKKLLAQDLAGHEARDVTARVRVVGTRVEVPRDLIHEIGLSNASKNDLSNPRMVMTLI